jgi:uncharacterized protein involved in response to NO
MATSSQKQRAYTGPAIFSYGFRPLFLLAGIWGFLAMLLWILMLQGLITLPLATGPVDWHVHEFLFGYLSAVIAGFVLTAVPNWTGRLPIIGAPLAGLVALWLAGRLVMAMSDLLPFWLVGLVDSAFLLALWLAVLREVLAGRNWRNLPVAGLIGLILLANVLFHVEAVQTGAPAQGFGSHLAIAAVVLLIALIGGRVTPSFTRNWLAKNAPGSSLPHPADRADMAILLLTAVSLAIWLILPEAVFTGVALMLTGLANFWRLSRWSGHHCRAEPLVWILHVAFAFIPLGFLLLGAALIWPDMLPPTGMMHSWLAGAFASMTLAVMTRAALGHTGYALTAGPGITLIYLAILTAAFLRLAAAFWPANPWLIPLSGTSWMLAYGLFVVIYAPLLMRPKMAPKTPSCRAG